MTMQSYGIVTDLQTSPMVSLNQGADNLHYLFQGQEMESTETLTELFYLEPVSGTQMKYVRV